MNKEQRNAIRKQILAARDRLSNYECEEQSSSISSRLMPMQEIIDAGIVFVYMHFRSEVQTNLIINRLLNKGKTVAIPKTLPAQSRLVAVKITDPDHQVDPGYCGIPEPKEEIIETESCNPEAIDVVIVPGSVFDKQGGRLGYGGGYYDRFLVNDAPNALRIGLAFELQITERVPVEPHDQLMDYIITEENFYDCRRNRHA